MKPGHLLRNVREQLGLTLRDVEVASTRIASKYRNNEFAIPLSRLSEIETKGVVPSVFRLHSLAVVYRRDIRELLAMYGIDLSQSAADFRLTEVPNTHAVTALEANTEVRIPVRLDPGFDPRRTCNLGRMIEQWGLVPLAFLSQLANDDFTYAYVGSQDFTMFPLILPGSFLQVDETKDTVEQRMWRNEYERPIYLVETREGFTCSWCSIKGDQLVLQPHPLSPVSIRILKHPQEAEVVGQVVGVAMRLDLWRSGPPSQGPKGTPALN